MDLKLLKDSSPVALNLPEDIKKLREDAKKKKILQNKEEKPTECTEIKSNVISSEGEETENSSKKAKLDDVSGPKFRVSSYR